MLDICSPQRKTQENLQRRYFIMVIDVCLLHKNSSTFPFRMRVLFCTQADTRSKLTQTNVYIHKSLIHKNSLTSKEKDTPNKSEEILLLNGFSARNRKNSEVSSLLGTSKEKMNQKLHPTKLQSRVPRDYGTDTMKKRNRYGKKKQKEDLKYVYICTENRHI